MSTDFDVVCDRCKKYRHLGQRMASAFSFGFGSADYEGRAEAAEFIYDHLGCGPLRIVNSDGPDMDEIAAAGYECVTWKDLRN